MPYDMKKQSSTTTNKRCEFKWGRMSRMVITQSQQLRSTNRSSLLHTCTDAWQHVLPWLCVFACKNACSNRVQRCSATARRAGSKCPKMAPFSRATACFLQAAVAHQNASHLSTLEPPGWHRAGWGLDILSGVEKSS